MKNQSIATHHVHQHSYCSFTLSSRSHRSIYWQGRNPESIKETHMGRTWKRDIRHYPEPMNTGCIPTLNPFNLRLQHYILCNCTILFYILISFYIFYRSVPLLCLFTKVEGLHCPSIDPECRRMPTSPSQSFWVECRKCLQLASPVLLPVEQICLLFLPEFPHAL